MRGRCAADGCRCGDDVSFMCYVPFTFMCGTFLSLIAIEMCRLCVANVLSCVAYVSLMCRLCVVYVWCILVTDFWSLTLTHYPPPSYPPLVTCTSLTPITANLSYMCHIHIGRYAATTTATRSRDHTQV